MIWDLNFAKIIFYEILFLRRHIYPFHSPRPPTNNLSLLVPANSSDPIPVIDQLYSPKFPLEVIREFVMEAIQEAVAINQVHNRDPIGGSNENLFL